CVRGHFRRQPDLVTDTHPRPAREGRARLETHDGLNRLSRLRFDPRPDESDRQALATLRRRKADGRRTRRDSPGAGRAMGRYVRRTALDHPSQGLRPMTKHPDLFAALSAPFEQQELKLRSQAGKQLTYITARTAMNRLDNVLGPENWWDEYSPS